MKADGKSDYTINFTRKALPRIQQYAPLTQPEAVKTFIATLNVSNGYKKNLCIAYNRYCQFAHIKWNRPRYEQDAKNIALPTREKLLMIIAEAGKQLGIRLQMSLETGLRPVELCRLRVRDVDLEHRTVNPTTAKRGNPRTLPISISLTTKLEERIQHKRLAPNDNLFGNMTADQYGCAYRKVRNRLAKKLNDATIRTIRLYDYRHYFCTKKLYDTGNPYTVMVLMGHKRLATTQRYMHLLNYRDEEYTVAGATTAKEASKLLEAGFQYQTTIEGVQLFRKRK
jgi:integrase